MELQSLLGKRIAGALIRVHPHILVCAPVQVAFQIGIFRGRPAEVDDAQPLQIQKPVQIVSSGRQAGVYKQSAPFLCLCVKKCPVILIHVDGRTPDVQRALQLFRGQHRLQNRNSRHLPADDRGDFPVNGTERIVGLIERGLHPAFRQAVFLDRRIKLACHGGDHRPAFRTVRPFMGQAVKRMHAVVKIIKGLPLELLRHLIGILNMFVIQGLIKSVIVAEIGFPAGQGAALKVIHPRLLRRSDEHGKMRLVQLHPIFAHVKTVRRRNRHHVLSGKGRRAQIAFQNRFKFRAPLLHVMALGDLIQAEPGDKLMRILPRFFHRVRILVHIKSQLPAFLSVRDPEFPLLRPLLPAVFNDGLKGKSHGRHVRHDDVVNRLQRVIDEKRRAADHVFIPVVFQIFRSLLRSRVHLHRNGDHAEQLIGRILPLHLHTDRNARRQTVKQNVHARIGSVGSRRPVFCLSRSRLHVRIAGCQFVKKSR